MKTAYNEQRVNIYTDAERFPGYYPIFSGNKPEMMFTKEECEKIIALTETIEGEDATTGYGGIKTATQTDNKIRSATEYPLYPTEETEWIYTKIMNIIKTANDEYFKYDISHLVAPLSLMCYDSDREISGHYDWHRDVGDGNTSTRKISITIQLSDENDYEECDLIVVDSGQHVAVREQGSISLFPSYVMHRVNPVENGKRYALVTWIHGPQQFK